LGRLAADTGSSTTFTAGPGAGTDTLFVNATLNGETVESLPVSISILASAVPSPSKFLGLSGDTGYVLLGLIIAVAIADTVLLSWLWKLRSGRPIGSVGTTAPDAKDVGEAPPEGPTNPAGEELENVRPPGL
jgi:hypothetical protein